MGQEAFERWSKALAEDEVTSEVMLMRMMPEISNPSEEVVKVAPDFWQPKRVASVSHPMPKLADTAKATRWHGLFSSERASRRPIVCAF